MPTSRTALAVGLGVVILAVTVLVGWHFDLRLLQGVMPGLATMKANTALGLAACGLAVALSGAGRGGTAATWSMQALALAVMLLAALTLSQDLFGWQLGIDEALVRDTGVQVQTTQPGRMSPASAFCFMLTALALAALAAPISNAIRQPLVTALAASLAVVGGLALLGLLTEGWLSQPWWHFKGMALPTALAFALLGLGLLALARRERPEPWVLGWPGTASVVLGIALMMAASNVTFGYVDVLRQAASAMDQVQDNEKALVDVARAMRELESNQRTFVLTGDDALLAGRAMARQALARDLDQLRPLVDTEPTHRARLDALRRLVEQRNAFGEETIELRRSRGFEEARRMIASGGGTAVTNQIERLLQAMSADNQRALSQRRQVWAGALGVTSLLLPLGMLISLVTLAIGLFFVNQNLGRTRQAQLATQQIGRRQASIVESAMDAIIGVDDEQHVVIFNQAAERMFGCTAAQALGLGLERFLPAPVRAAHAGHMQAFGRTGETARSMRSLGALTALRADGSEFPIEASISHVELAGRQVYTVILRDITQRLEAERTLRESEERLQALIANLGEGLIVADLDGQVRHWNRAGIEMHGFTDLAEGVRCLPDFADTFELSTLAGDPIALSRWPMARVLAGETVRDVVLRIRRRDKPWQRVFSYSGAVVQYAGEQRMAFVSTVDVTERESAKEERQRLNAVLEQRVAERTAQLEAKSRELESFCYSVSHDLKAPLRGIDGYSRLLLDDHAAQLDEDGRLCANNVRIATQQMSTLIEDLLAYSRQERRSLNPAPVDLQRFVNEQIERRRADFAAVVLEVDVGAVRVAADAEALAIALRNLIDNALKFSAHCKPAVISVRSRIEGRRCVLSVQDNGTGFDMRFHDRIFEIFQRLHRAEDYPGTGIGLALVRKAAERMGGRVWAQSAPGAGATFFLELGLAEEAATAAIT